MIPESLLTKRRRDFYFMTTESTTRFSDRVAHYIKWRPGYPDEVYAELINRKVIATGNTIADIGAGTGLSAKLFLKHKHPVLAVEPNAAMRNAGQELLIDQPIQFYNGTAEATQLPAASVDTIVAAQAFHWFNTQTARKEFQRILRPNGQVILIWNDRIVRGDDFSEAYEEALRYFAIDYAQVDHKQITDTAFDAFWGTGNWQTFAIPNVQELTFEGLLGRVLSSSYMPKEDHPDFSFMQHVLKKIFLRYQNNGSVAMRYDTRVFYGSLN